MIMMFISLFFFIICVSIGVAEAKTIKDWVAIGYVTLFSGTIFCLFLWHYITDKVEEGIKDRVKPECLKERK